jgi:hypothetical protein
LANVIGPGLSYNHLCRSPACSFLSYIALCLLILMYFLFILDWGPVPRFCPLEALQPVWLTPEVYCTIPRFSNRSYSGHQVSLASTTRGSPLATRGGTMGGNSDQMMPGICTQGSLTCRKSATWDLYFSARNMGPIILLPFRRKAC